MNSIIISINVMKRLLKEITSLGFIFLFPIIAALLTVLMFSPKTNEVGIAGVSVHDQGLKGFLEEKGNYQFQMIPSNEISRIEEMVGNGEFQYGIIFPHGTASNGKIQLISTQNDENTQVLMGDIEAYMEAVTRGETLHVESVESDNRGELEKAKTAMGMIAMFMIMFIGTGMQLLLEDKRLKTFMRSFCSPLMGFETALGHLLANLLLGILQITIFLIFSVKVLKFDFGTGIFNLFILLLIFLITAIGLGIALVGFVKDSSKYNLILTILSITLSFLGGAFFSLKYMNELIKKLSNLTPQKWLLDAFEKLALGGSLMDIGIEVTILLLFGLVFFTFGIKSLKLSPIDT